MTDSQAPARWERSLQWLIVLGTTAFVVFLGGDPGVPNGPYLLSNALRRDLVGCYALMTAPGHLLDRHNFYNASPMVYLDSTPRPHILSTGRDLGTKERVLVQLDSAGDPIGGVQPTGILGPSWSTDSLTNTLYVSFSNGFSGAELILQAPLGRGDTLRGRIIENWDFGPPFSDARGRGMAVRRPCRAR